MWIVQEVVLGKKCVVLVGSFSVSWEDLRRSALCLEEDADHEVEAHRVVMMITEFKRERKNVTYPGHRSLINLIHHSFNLLCTNSRDKVYGILGLAEDIIPGEIIPDYSLPCQEVYLATTILCMQKYNSLDIICQVRNPKLFSGMPSWVPDWTVISSLRESLAFKPWENYSAAGAKSSPTGFSIPFHISNDKRRLFADGKFVGRIQNVGSVMPDRRLSEENINDRYEVVLEWGEYARKLSPYITGETFPTTFWRVLLADGGTRGKDSDRTRQLLYESYQNLLERNTGSGSELEDWEPVDEMSVVNSRCMEFERLMDLSCVGRRIAITENGFLGFVPGDAKVGDEIVILETVRVPLVLRCVPSSTDYSLVGESYVQGWMDGARFSGLSGLNVQFSIV